MAEQGAAASAGRITIGRITLDLQRVRLLVDGNAVRLRPQSFDVLRVLVEHRDQLVSRQQLLDAVWGSRVVTGDSLVQCLVDIRRALSDGEHRIILTIPGRGYLFQSDRIGDGIPVDAGTRGRSLRAGLAAATIGGVAAMLAMMFWTGDGAHAPEPTQPAIAVLPFVDLTESQDRTFLASGLAEEIRNQLSGSPDMRVIARTSSFGFGSDEPDIAAIAETLSATHVLAGSIREGDERIRIAVHLVDTADEAQIWARTYDQPMRDILDVQTDIAGSVAAALQVSLASRSAADTDPYSHALTIQARSMILLSGAARIAEAQEMLRQALALDPGNVSALVTLADAVRKTGRRAGGERILSAWQESIELTNRALAMDPDHPVAIAQRGFAELHFYEDYAAAARSFERAVSLDATDPDVVRLASNALLVLDQPETGMRMGLEAVLRDPLCVPCHMYLSLAAQFSGELDLAERSARRVLEFSPQNQAAFERLGDVLLARGDAAAALSAFSQRTDEHPGLLMSRAIAYFMLGDRDQFDRIRKQLIDDHGDRSPSAIAQLEAVAGNPDEAFAWLERHLAQPNWARGVNYHSPFYDNLREDARWTAYRRRMGLSAEQLAIIDFNPVIPY